MANCGDYGQTIIRTWIESTAPTGESVRYETADGKVWEDDLTPLRERTGQRLGVQRGDRIYPR